jgi:hypothetical protein
MADSTTTLKAALQQELLQTVSLMIFSRMNTAWDTVWLEIKKLLTPEQLAFVLHELEAAGVLPAWLPAHGIALVPPPAGACCGSDEGELYEPPEYPPADSDSDGDSEDP